MNRTRTLPPNPLIRRIWRHRNVATLFRSPLPNEAAPPYAVFPVEAADSGLQQTVENETDWPKPSPSPTARRQQVEFVRSPSIAPGPTSARPVVQTQASPTPRPGWQLPNIIRRWLRREDTPPASPAPSATPPLPAAAQAPFPTAHSASAPPVKRQVNPAQPLATPAQPLSPQAAQPTPPPFTAPATATVTPTAGGQMVQRQTAVAPSLATSPQSAPVQTPARASSNSEDATWRRLQTIMQRHEQKQASESAAAGQAAPASAPGSPSPQPLPATEQRSAPAPLPDRQPLAFSETPPADADETATLPLEKVWPVQRQETPLAAAISAPPPIENTLALQPEEEQQLRQAVQKAKTGQPTNSSVEVILPRSPRPPALAKSASPGQTAPPPDTDQADTATDEMAAPPMALASGGPDSPPPPATPAPSAIQRQEAEALPATPPAPGAPTRAGEIPRLAAAADLPDVQPQAIQTAAATQPASPEAYRPATSATGSAAEQGDFSSTDSHLPPSSPAPIPEATTQIVAASGRVEEAESTRSVRALSPSTTSLPETNPQRLAAQNLAVTTQPAAPQAMPPAEPPTTRAPQSAAPSSSWAADTVQQSPFPAAATTRSSTPSLPPQATTAHIPGAPTAAAAPWNLGATAAAPAPQSIQRQATTAAHPQATHMDAARIYTARPPTPGGAVSTETEHPTMPHISSASAMPESAAVAAIQPDEMPELIPTEIGPLPRDLWQLIGQPPGPQSGRAGRRAAGAGQVVQATPQATGGAALSPTRPLWGAAPPESPAAPGQPAAAGHTASAGPQSYPPQTIHQEGGHETPEKPALENVIFGQAAVQRETVSSQAAGSAGPSSTAGEEAAQGAPKLSEAELDQLARQVYQEIRQQIARERERARGWM
jgi:hypothetical protein